MSVRNEKAYEFGMFLLAEMKKPQSPVGIVVPPRMVRDMDVLRRYNAGRRG